MEKELEKVMEAYQNLAEAHKSLSQKDAEKSGTIAELSLQLETLRQKREFERKRYRKDMGELKTLRGDFTEICNPILNSMAEVIKDNRKHQKMLSEITLLPIFGSSSQSSPNCPSGDENDLTGDDGFQQLKKFVKDCELGVQSREKVIERKEINVKSYINLDQADMKRVEEAETRKIELLAAMKAQEGRLESHKKNFTALQAIFSLKPTQQSSEMEEQEIELNQRTLEKGELSHSNRNAETAGKKSDDVRVRDSDNYTSGCITDASNVDTLITDPPSVTAASNLSEIIGSSTTFPLFESVGKNGQVLNLLKGKRKRMSLDDDEETSKRMRSSDLATGADECTVYSKRLHAVREELRKGNPNPVHVRKEVSKEEVSGSPSLIEPPPVASITREQAREFTSINEHHYGIFSWPNHVQSYSLATFLMYKPIGIVNPGHKFCYMNSVVQALANVPLFSLTVVCSIEGEEGSLLNALFETYKYLWLNKYEIETGSRPRPAVLEAKEIRDYYATNHGNMFDPTRQHDADEFLMDLITNLEQEVLNLDGGAGKGNLVTGLFKGYILNPDGSRDYFYTLRLSVKDQSIHTVGDALLYHLRINSAEPTQPLPATDDCDAKHYEDSFQNLPYADHPMAGEFRKICAPEILCLFLDRRNADYSVNLKSLTIGGLSIPTDLQAPVGMTKPAKYRLMSAIKYIPGDSTQSSGHYYTCTLSPVGYACVINDERVETMEESVFNMSAYQGWSSILIYAKQPENLE